jgi:thymidylate kinase
MGEISMIAFDKEVQLTNHQRSNTPPAIDLVVILCHTLAAEEIDYCHWKSNEALDRSASGENDLDLLVSRVDAERFAEILYRLDFKAALTPAEDELPGVRSYYGYDRKTCRLVHVHAHFQLILGNDLSKNYRLPLERLYLDSAVQGELFRVPAPEFELLIFVIRMVLKHSTWDSLLMRHGQLSSSERREFHDLATSGMVSKAHALLHHVPGFCDRLFDECVQALRPGCSIWTRIRAGEQLQNVLQASTRRSHLADVMLKLTRRIWQPLQRRVFRYKPRHQMASGGLFIAIVGGDGAGKTTIVDDLFTWLAGKFDVTKVHLGKPDWSWMTTAIRSILKIGTILRLYPFEGDVYEEAHQSHGFPWFIRAVCTARDRYLTYVHARRLSSNGSLVLCDRFSFPGFMEMDGPQCERALTSLKNVSRLHTRLAKWEASYYEQIKLPDLLIVLKVDPEIAVQRKAEESKESVHARSSEVWRLDWKEKSAFVIDASLPRKDVVSQVQALVWEHL